MNEYTATMNRNEKKYLMNENQYLTFMALIRGCAEMDGYGRHTISNIYLDNDNFEAISQSMDKPLYKEKVRLRAYGDIGETTLVFLEVKKKFESVVYKRRIQMDLQAANAYLFEGVVGDCCQILKEIDWIKHGLKLVPKFYLAYDRMAFTDNRDDSVRFTIDSKIRWRVDDVALERGDFGYEIMHGWYLLEVKVASSMPLWLSNLLSQLKIYPRSFSKYGRCYLDYLERKRDVSYGI